MDRGAWRATVHGVTKSQTRLKRLSTHTYTILFARGFLQPHSLWLKVHNFGIFRSLVGFQSRHFRLPPWLPALFSTHTCSFCGSCLSQTFFSFLSLSLPLLSPRVPHSPRKEMRHFQVVSRVITWTTCWSHCKYLLVHRLWDMLMGSENIWFHLCDVSSVIKLIKTESRVEVTRAWRKRRPGSQCLLET